VEEKKLPVFLQGFRDRMKRSYGEMVDLDSSIVSLNPKKKIVTSKKGHGYDYSFKFSQKKRRICKPKRKRNSNDPEEIRITTTISKKPKSRKIVTSTKQLPGITSVPQLPEERRTYIPPPPVTFTPEPEVIIDLLGIRDAPLTDLLYVDDDLPLSMIPSDEMIKMFDNIIGDVPDPVHIKLEPDEYHRRHDYIFMNEMPTTPTETEEPTPNLPVESKRPVVVVNDTDAIDFDALYAQCLKDANRPRAKRKCVKKPDVKMASQPLRLDFDSFDLDKICDALLKETNKENKPKRRWRPGVLVKKKQRRASAAPAVFENVFSSLCIDVM
jgi:hypothetical protein